VYFLQIQLDSRSECSVKDKLKIRHTYTYKEQQKHLLTEALVFKNHFTYTFSHAHTEAHTHKHTLILVAFITGNSSLEPLLEGLLAQIHIDMS